MHKIVLLASGLPIDRSRRFCYQRQSRNASLAAAIRNPKFSHDTRALPHPPGQFRAPGVYREKGKWLHGKWLFDAEYTKQRMAEMEKTADHASKDLVGGLAKLGEGVVVPQLLSALEGAQLNVTDKELIMTTRDGTGKTNGYEVVEAPDGDTLKLKQSDGEVNTYHREGRTTP